MKREVRFVCASCGVRVTQYNVDSLPDPAHCSVCSYLHALIADPVERAAALAQHCHAGAVTE